MNEKGLVISRIFSYDKEESGTFSPKIVGGRVILMEEKEKLCCPHCGQPLEDEETHACAQCGALYHQACWEAQGGCSNPACLPEQPEQEETLAVCPRCGAPWSDAHKFCAKCGMPKEACAPLACQNCGEPLRQGQSFCAKCGQKTQQEPFAGDSPAVQPPARKKSKTPVILAIVLAVLLLFGAVGGFFAYQVAQIHSYKADAKAFYTTAISAGAKLEEVGNDIHQNWNDYIYNRYSIYGSIESAVAAAQRENASEISLIKASTAVLEEKYQKLLKLPLLKGDEVEEIRDAVKEAYAAYGDLYSCVIDVKGNYRTYTENFNDFDTQASKALRALDALLEE